MVKLNLLFIFVQKIYRRFVFASAVVRENVEFAAQQLNRLKDGLASGRKPKQVFSELINVMFECKLNAHKRKCDPVMAAAVSVQAKASFWDSFEDTCSSPNLPGLEIIWIRDASIEFAQILSKASRSNTEKITTHETQNMIDFEYGNQNEIFETEFIKDEERSLPEIKVQPLSLLLDLDIFDINKYANFEDDSSKELSLPKLDLI